MRMLEKVTKLFDFAADRPDGFTRDDVFKDLGFHRTEFVHVASRLRQVLGHDDSINLVCEPNGQGRPYVYRLVGTMDDARIWTAQRIKNTETSLMTIQGVVHSMCAATDGRTLDGRRARIMDRALTRLLEDLSELDHGTPLFKA